MIRMTSKNKYNVQIAKTFCEVAQSQNELKINTTIEKSQVNHMITNMRAKAIKS